MGLGFPSEHIHVVPVNDRKEHYTNGHYCHCNPRIEWAENRTDKIVVHNSYDGREFFENED